MSSNEKPAKRLYTLATAIGLALGTMGIAAAASPSTATGPAPNQVEAPSVASDGQPTELGEEAEASSDEDADGIDHQFEGEEFGNNGDGTADADDAAEVANTP